MTRQPWASTSPGQPADPDRALDLIAAGMPLRVGRSVGRTLYVQTSDDPSKNDLLIGQVDSPEIAEWLVGLANARPFDVITDPVKADDLAGIAPDWTGGKTPEEYVFEQRNRGT